MADRVSCKFAAWDVSEKKGWVLDDLSWDASRGSIEEIVWSSCGGVGGEGGGENQSTTRVQFGITLFFSGGGDGEFVLVSSGNTGVENPPPFLESTQWKQLEFNNSVTFPAGDRVAGHCFVCLIVWLLICLFVFVFVQLPSKGCLEERLERIGKDRCWHSEILTLFMSLRS